MKALVVAGGLPQITLIQELKASGIETVLIDGNENAIARPYADRFHQTDVFDVDGVKKIALEEKVSFLITVCADQVLLVVAQVSEELGLPCYIDYETARLVSDKTLMKERFMKRGIPTTNYVILSDYEEERVNGLKFPLIVKPVDAYSSKGVSRVNEAKDLLRAWEEAKSQSRTGRVIAEEYFDGEEISVDLFVQDGKAKILCLSNSEKIRDQERFVIFRGRWPVHASDALKEEIQRVCQSIADAFEIKNAPLLVQMLTDGKKVSVLEFCARTGGAMKWLLIQRASGVDVIKSVIDLTLGGKPDIHVQKSEAKIIVNDFIYCKKGKYDHLEGFEEQLKQGNIVDYRLLRPKGWEFSGFVTSSTDRICGVTFEADTVEELNKKHQEFLKNVKVMDVNGNDVMRHDLLPDVES